MTAAPMAWRRAGWRGWAGLALATLVLHLVLIQPNHPAAMTPGAVLLFPLELPAILLALLALPRDWPASWLLRMTLVLALSVIAVLKLADFATFTAFNRGFNPLVDAGLVVAAWRLGSGTVGIALAALAVAAVFLAVAALAWALWRAMAAWAAPRLAPGLAAVAGVGAVLSTALAVGEAGQALRLWSLPVKPPGAAFTARVGYERAVMARTTLADLADFRAAAATDPFAGAPSILDRLAGRDVLLIFVESYARASFDNPLYAPTHVQTLAAAASRIEGAGLEARTGWLAAPIEGGRSWLAHGTLAAGLRIDNQTRYGAMIASPRRTLFHLARDAGYHTVAVMPAITLAWPEGARLGFDTVLARDDMGYAGLPFNWVTMPDQFTLGTFRDRVPSDPRPLFAQVTLISSHAPWVPVPRLVGWDALGDGTVFNAMAQEGDRPEVVWRDRDRVRDQYRQSVDYVLQTVMDYAARQGADAPLMIVLGDHPPAGFVSQIDSPDVAVHLIGPPGVLAAVEEWGFTPGLVPDAATPRWPMEAFRDRFLRAFSTGAGDGT